MNNSQWLKVIEQFEADKEKILIQKVGKKIYRKEELILFLGDLRIIINLDSKPRFELPEFHVEQPA